MVNPGILDGRNKGVGEGQNNYHGHQDLLFIETCSLMSVWMPWGMSKDTMCLHYEASFFPVCHLFKKEQKTRHTHGKALKDVWGKENFLFQH